MIQRAGKRAPVHVSFQDGILTEGRLSDSFSLRAVVLMSAFFSLSKQPFALWPVSSDKQGILLLQL